MTPTIQARLCSIAAKEVGTKEEHNNSGDRIITYQRATWLAVGPWPWCAAFCCWLLKEAIGGEKYVAAPVYPIPAVTAESWRCKDASAFGWIKWGKRNGHQILDERDLAKKGDFVVFDFSHIGLVVEDQGTLAEPIVTIEGNTSDAGGREGDGVYRKKRNPNLVRAYIRLTKPEEN